MPWDRRAHAPGGGDALLHYVVPGARPEALKVSRSRHRVESVPEALHVAGGSAAEAGLEALLAEPAFAGALDEALGASAEAVRRAGGAVVAHGEFPDPPDLGYLRDTLGVVAALLDAGGLAVLDVPALRWWSPEAFRGEVHARDDVDAFQQVSLLATARPDGEWLHTRGLRKFGRRDLSVPGVAPAWRAGALEMIERLVWAQVRGHLVPDGQAISVGGVPEGLRCHHGGSLEDPEFNNLHVEIR